jgi:transcriptional regulator with XRE-family HTH domain
VKYEQEDNMASKLKLALVQRNIRQIELAKKIGISESRFSKIVNGWITPNSEEVLKISSDLGIPVEDILPESN